MSKTEKSNLKTKPQELNNIPGVKDLTSENAASVSGGWGYFKRR